MTQNEAEDKIAIIVGSSSTVSPKMVLRSSAAQYTRHHGEDDPEEAATGILEDTVPTTYPRESRSNSLVNANRYYYTIGAT